MASREVDSPAQPRVDCFLTILKEHMPKVEALHIEKIAGKGSLSKQISKIDGVATSCTSTFHNVFSVF